MNKISVCYIGSAFPHEPEFFWNGFSRAGNLAQLGIVEALKTCGIDLDKVISFRPIGNYPRDKIIFAKGYKQKIFEDVYADVFPLFNIFPMRNFIRYVFLIGALIKWTFKNFKKARVVVVYNVFFPNLALLRLVTKLLRIRLVPIIFDWGDIDGWKVDWKTRLANPKWAKEVAIKAVKKCDGLMPITDSIAEDANFDKEFMRLDGGVTQRIIDMLFPLEIKDKKEFVLFFAGNIDKWNHIDTLLEFMQNEKDSNLRLWFAGKGGSGPELVKKMSQKDDRIVFWGMLSHKELIEKYKECDVLVSLRDTIDPALKHHFPSKLLEMLTIGRPVITTNPSHTRSVYGRYCFVIDSSSVEDFKIAVNKIRLMSSFEQCEFGKRARAFMLKEHTWAAQGVRIRKYLESIVF